MINSKRCSRGATAARALAGAVVVSAQQQQQQQPAAANPGVQVGVPRGSRSGGAANGPAGRGRGRNPGPPPGPAPRNAEGRVLLGGATPKDKGVWLPGGGGGQTVQSREPIPFQPWAKALLDDRAKNQLEPHTRCKPSGLRAPVPDAVRRRVRRAAGDSSASSSSTSAARTRTATIYMDGRTHPTNLAPTYYGHSIGWWEGDTLVVDTIGYNEGFWIDRRGSPHTEKLHTLEKFTRTNDRHDPLRDARGRSGRLHEAVVECVRSAVGSGNGALRVRLPADELRADADGRCRRSPSIAPTRSFLSRR